MEPIFTPDETARQNQSAYTLEQLRACHCPTIELTAAQYAANQNRGTSADGAPLVANSRWFIVQIIDAPAPPKSLDDMTWAWREDDQETADDADAHAADADRRPVTMTSAEYAALPRSNRALLSGMPFFLNDHDYWVRATIIDARTDLDALEYATVTSGLRDAINAQPSTAPRWRGTSIQYAALPSEERGRADGRYYAVLSGIWRPADIIDHATAADQLTAIVGATLAQLIRIKSEIPNLRGQILRRCSVFVPDAVPAADLEAHILREYAQQQRDSADNLIKKAQEDAERRANDPLHGMTWEYDWTTDGPRANEARLTIRDIDETDSRPGHQPLKMTFAEFTDLPSRNRARFVGILTARRPDSDRFVRVYLTDRPDLTGTAPAHAQTIAEARPTQPPPPALSVEVTEDRQVSGTCTFTATETYSGQRDFTDAELLEIAERHDWNLDDMAEAIENEARETDLDHQETTDYEYNNEAADDISDSSTTFSRYRSALAAWIEENRPDADQEEEEE